VVTQTGAPASHNDSRQESCRQAQPAAADTADDGAPTWPPPFEVVYQQFQHPIYRYVLRLLGNEHEALDLTQDVFVRVFRALPRLRGDTSDNVQAWVYRIATNIRLDQLRRRRIIRWQPIDGFITVFHPDQGAGTDPLREAERQETRRLVQRALDCLAPNHRAALLMREYQDLSCDEIALVLGTTHGAVKSVLFRARESFRHAYRALGGEA
jgi:RNA polymerase sigma-70 factor (ECF subfamily)